MMVGTTLRPGQLVQINPDLCQNVAFSGCVMIVSEPTSSGAKCYMHLPIHRDLPGMRTFYHAQWPEMELCVDNTVVWITA